MAKWRPDPSFYASPKLAMEAPAGDAGVRRAAGNRQPRPTQSASSTPIRVRRSYGRLVGQPSCRIRATNCTTSAGTRAARTVPVRAPPAHGAALLVVPGTHSSRIHIVDTQPDPRSPRSIKVIEPRGGDAQDRLRRAAHRALRTGWHLHERARAHRRQRARAASSCSITRRSR